MKSHSHYFEISISFSLSNRTSDIHTGSFIVAWITRFMFGYVSRDSSPIIGQGGG